MNTATMERPPLVQIIGTVAEIVPAPAANRSGKIKLDDGKILSAFPDKLQLVYENETYDFGCVETNKGGVIYRDVKAVRPAAASPPRQVPLSTDPTNYPSRNAPPRAQASQARPGPVQRSEPVEPPRQPAPQQNGNGYYRPTSPEDKKSMFRCAMMTAALKSHQVSINRNDIASAIVEIDAGYDLAMQKIGQEDAAG